MKKAAIIVAGGIGIRMNAGIPKQFVILAGKPLLMHTLKAFADFDAEMPLLVTIPKQYFKYWKTLCRDYTFKIKHQIVEGGETRFQSVRNALNYIPDGIWLAIHDGVRPMITKSMIELCFEEALSMGNAIPVISTYESLRIIDGSYSHPFDRSSIRVVQTPQVFPSSLIKKAYQQNYSADFTDDATVFESFGEKIHLTEGDPRNIKITNPVDLLIAKTFFDER